MLWDGLTFFGFDDTKLARLNGHPTSYLDKFKNKKWLSTSMLGLTIVLFVILSSASKLGTMKFQKIELTDQSQFKYNASLVLTHSAVNYFEASELLPKVRS